MNSRDHPERSPATSFSQILDGALCRAFKVQREFVSLLGTTGYTFTPCVGYLSSPGIHWSISMSTVNKISMHSEKHGVCRNHVIQPVASAAKNLRHLRNALRGH